MVPKVNGNGYQLLVNHSQLSNFLQAPHFKMGSIHDIILLLEQRAYMGMIDPKNAYVQIPLSQEVISYLAAAMGNKLWLPLGMPWGVQAVKGQHDQATAQQELLSGICKLVSCLSRQVPQQCAQAVTVPHKKPLLSTDSMPVRPLDECFLLWHTANKWVTHFSSMLSEYDTTGE